MKYSKQRELIYNWIYKNPVHPTADEVYYALKPEHQNLSLGTVYRNLNLLAEHGKLYKITVANASDRFDARIDSHQHMICEHCGKVFDIELPELIDIKHKIECENDFSLNKIVMVLHGTCNKCKHICEEAIN